METETGRKIFGTSDKDGRTVEIREYRYYIERFADLSTGRVQSSKLILRVYPAGDIVTKMQADPKAYKIVRTDEIIREI